MGKNPTSLSINTINEGTSGSGVTVDGVKHKDYNLYVGDYGESATELASGYSGIVVADLSASLIQFNNAATLFNNTDGFVVGLLGGSGELAKQGYVWNKEDSDILFGTNNIERFRVTNPDYDGESHVLFGTANPTIAYSNADTGVAINVDSAAIQATANSGIALHVNRLTSDGILVSLNKNGAPVGSISVTASAAAFNTSSDYRLKEDIQPMVNACERLKALKPVNFAWKVDGTRVDGFIAHEAQEVVPEAVVGTKDAVDENQNPIYQGIDQAKLVPLLTKALQEALARIEALENA
jgi:hypothetical protein